MILRKIQYALMLISVAVIFAVFCGCAQIRGGRVAVPAWVSNPVSIEKEYSRNQWYIGFGVCGGASSQDSISRIQAERSAVADIASVVEVQINDTIEDQDTSIERNGKLLVQSVRIRTTKMVVTGILSGIEIKQVFFDKRSMNWHAFALLNRTRAGAGALEAVKQRLERGQAVLDGLGSGPVSDFIAIRRLGVLVTELDRLAVALAIFAPSYKANACAEIDAFKDRVVALYSDAGSRAKVRVVLNSSSDINLPVCLGVAVTKPLMRAGFTVVDYGDFAELRVNVEVNTATQRGSMLVYKVSSGATFELVERERIIADGSVSASNENSSRSGSKTLSRTRSLELLSEQLQMEIDEMLNK